MGESALATLGTVVFVIEFSADVFGRFWLENLSFDGVGEEAVEAILAVPGKIMDARIHIFRLMLFATLLGIATLLNSKILFGAQFADVHKL